MNFTFAHNNLNVYDLDASLRFYKEALGLTVTRTKEADDGSFKLVYLGDSDNSSQTRTDMASGYGPPLQFGR